MRVGDRLVGVDGHADPGHARGVRHREIVLVADREQRKHLDLAALVHPEGSIPRLDQRDLFGLGNQIDDRLLVFFVTTVDDDVALEGRTLRHESVDGEDVAACIADRGSESTEDARSVFEADPEIDRILGCRLGAHNLSS